MNMKKLANANSSREAREEAQETEPTSKGRAQAKPKAKAKPKEQEAKASEAKMPEATEAASAAKAPEATEAASAAKAQDIQDVVAQEPLAEEGERAIQGLEGDSSASEDEDQKANAQNGNAEELKAKGVSTQAGESSKRAGGSKERLSSILPSKPKATPIANVLIVAAESAPLAKTGGLADVVGALPKYLKKQGIDARIMMPFHRAIKERYASETTHLFDYNASPVWPSRFVGVDKLELDGTTYYFIDNEYYFNGGIYSGGNFEGVQYGFFAQAVCDVIPNLDFDPQIVHCNDWHTAIVPFKLKAKAAREGSKAPGTLLTIHNLAFQGTFGEDINNLLVGPDERAYAWDLGAWNMMKAGIDTADKVNTVSPTYAWEITTPEFGEGLQDDLRFLRDDGRLWGILNGIDVDTWDPKKDANLAANYSMDDLSGKRECKRELLEELGMDVDLDAPLIAMVGRLTPQKGIGIAADIIETLVWQNARFVVLGSGDSDLEDRMRYEEEAHKGYVCSYIGYNDSLAHRIYAASDFFLMPSAFEPCGISQMIAMRYGSLPIVHEIGGLKDTVEPYNQYTDFGTGFTFSRFDYFDAVEACKRALSVYGNDDIMSRLIQNAMSKDFSFDLCAKTYAELYETLI